MATQKKDQPKKTEMATTAGAQQGTAIATEMPDYLKQNAGNRGRENVGADDLVIPRLELVQDLSPARKRSDPNYIEGAQEGMLYNNVTRELYGTKVLVIPVGYVKEWLLWKDRKQGGGFGGAFASEAEAKEARDLLEDGDAYEVVDTGQQFCILVHPDGRTEEIVVSMAKSKAKISRKWNSLIRIANGDSFSRVYELAAVEETNKQNQKYFNLSVRAAGFPPEPLYRKAEAMYQNIARGVVKADRGVDESGESGSGRSGEY